MKLIEEASFRDKDFVFKNREEAGKLLAEKLVKYTGIDTFVFAIPSGGIPVAWFVAKKLGSGFDLVISRKIQFPYNPEAGFGAVSFDGEIILNKSLIKNFPLEEEVINQQISKAFREAKIKDEMFRGSKRFPDIKGKTVIVVDDGLASGYTMLAALKSIKKRKPKKLIVAVPTGNSSAINLVKPEVDEIYCLNVRDRFIFAVADAYDEWHDVSEEEALKWLRKKTRAE